VIFTDAIVVNVRDASQVRNEPSCALIVVTLKGERDILACGNGNPKPDGRFNTPTYRP
jgi:transposase-like protein